MTPEDLAKPLTRAEKAEEKRNAILKAARIEFIAKGFESARIDEIAANSGVAKGTVYLHFSDKKTLFEETIRSVMMPLVNQASQNLDTPSASIRQAIERVLLPLLKKMLSTDIGPVLRLLIAEAIRFPQLGDFYEREVVSPMIEKLRILLNLASRAGELRNPAMAEFPQLLMAPILLTVIWQGTFHQLLPSDIAVLIKTHLDTLFQYPNPASDT